MQLLKSSVNTRSLYVLITTCYPVQNPPVWQTTLKDMACQLLKWQLLIHVGSSFPCQGVRWSICSAMTQAIQVLQDTWESSHHHLSHKISASACMSEKESHSSTASGKWLGRNFLLVQQHDVVSSEVIVNWVFDLPQEQAHAWPT